MNRALELRETTAKSQQHKLSTGYVIAVPEREERFLMARLLQIMRQLLMVTNLLKFSESHKNVDKKLNKPQTR